LDEWQILEMNDLGLVDAFEDSKTPFYWIIIQKKGNNFGIQSRKKAINLEISVVFVSLCYD
jgi:hypothetical protein